MGLISNELPSVALFGNSDDDDDDDDDEAEIINVLHAIKYIQKYILIYMHIVSRFIRRPRPQMKQYNYTENLTSVYSWIFNILYYHQRQ